ncbi:MAG: Phosphomannomutase/phosphoglucomutase [Candidatus Parcubacteria bacterium]|jgi:phosphomannomutase
MSSDVSSLFKAYDIRGLSPQQVDETFAARLGAVLTEEFHPAHVLVGWDMRQTSPALEAALTEAFVARGVNVTRIGQCSTPLFNVSVGLGNGAYDLGVMVTASHNPGQYNGFKLVRGDVSPIGQGSGMEQVRERFVSSDAFMPDVSLARGTVTNDPDALARYLDHVCALVDTANLPPIAMAIDAGNGMEGVILPALIKRLPQITFHTLYTTPDGSFPNHEANPLKIETLKDLSALVVKERCALGVAFDGDADRVGFVDEQGEPVPGDLLTAMLARPMLAAHPGARVLYDLRSSWSTRDAIIEAGGEPAMCRVGHAFIKRQMRQEGALFGGELSMHFYFKDLWNVESGDLALLLFLQLLAVSGQPLSALWKPLKRFAKTEEINSEVADADAALARVEKTFAPTASSISMLDGIRMEFGVAADGARGADAWWFSVRKSNTEPVVRLIVEAVSEKVMIEKRDALLEMIRG